MAMRLMLITCLFYVAIVKVVSSNGIPAACPDNPEFRTCLGCPPSLREFEAYFYLEDGTRCPACQACVMEDRIHEGCPLLPCPYVFPPNCPFKIIHLYMQYNGKECGACEAIVCK